MKYSSTSSKPIGSVKYVILFLFCSITIISCTRKYRNTVVEKELKSFLGSTIIFPENISITFEEITSSRDFVLISYIDSTDCTPCALKHIEVYKFYKDQLKNQFNTEILLLIQNNDEEGVKKMLSDIGVPFPFLLDIEKKFKSINNIPDNPTYQTLIVDEQRKIIWIGSPVENKKTWELYQKMMAKLSSKK
ncbi:hypothetical protein AGMMS50239_24820 [Bacteroidia bacterium]|nr:hypothetical protein AGMMS50239_24820 [Bacteroidia bacterium]